MVAYSSAGTTYGSDQTFTTAPIVIYIEPNASCGTGNTPCYSKIQDGIDAVGDGTTIKVAQGTYYENILVAYSSKTFTLEGGWDSNFISKNNDPSLTIIDGGRSDRVINIVAGDEFGIEVTNINIDDFTITNGSPSGNSGGAIYGYAYNGSYISLNLTNNNVTNNTAPMYGGGIFVNSGYGGSITLALENNVISENSSAGYGGGILASAYSGNTTLMLTNNIIEDNIAPYSGGGIWLQSDSSGSVTLSSTNNTVTGNTSSNYYGGGLYSYSYGMGSSINITMTNDILWGNTSGSLGGDLFVSQGAGGVSNVTITYSDIGSTYGNYTSNGTNLNTDPSFVDASNGDYHLRSNSQCIDRGTNTGAATTDIDGHSRPFDGDGNGIALTDIGADEYVGIPDTDGDGIPNGDGTNRCTGGEIANCDDNCRYTPNPDQTDTDNDGVGDACDNCRLVANPDQRDTNSSEDDNTAKPGIQHYGNVCDPDFDNDGDVGIRDFNEWRKHVGQDVPPAPDYIDLNNDGMIWIQDFNIWRSFYGGPPGPGIGD